MAVRATVEMGAAARVAGAVGRGLLAGGMEVEVKATVVPVEGGRGIPRRGKSHTQER